MDWDYKKRTYQVSMPGYVMEVLTSFQHKKPSRAQYAPHPWVTPTYGQQIQLTEKEDTSTLLDKEGVNLIQCIIRKFYYYARAVDHTMLVVLGELAIK